MKAYILVFLFSVAFAKEFSVKSDMNSTCALLSLSGKMDLTASQNAAEVGNVELSFDGATLVPDSNCTLIKLNMSKSAQAWFQFTPAAGDMWTVATVVAFTPDQVFGSNVTYNESVSTSGWSLGSFPKNESYVCKAVVSRPFDGKTASNYNFSVSATVSKFQIQSLENGSFAEEGGMCQEDKTTTSTISTSTTTATPKTTKPSTPDFTCEDGDETRIRLTGNINLKITYNTTENKNQTAYVDVPSNAATDGSNCNGNKTEWLVLNFFKGWMIRFDFARPEKTLLTATDTGSSYVTNITVQYKLDERFTNASKSGETVTETFSDLGKNYLKASSKGYYSCKSNTSISAQDVKMSFKNFKYTAFSTNNATLKGDVTECSADEDSSSIVPIAVGAALAGLVVIVLIAYLIGRKRSRKSGYESV